MLFSELHWLWRVKSPDRLGSEWEHIPTSLVAQWVKNPSGMQETLVGSLGREDLLEKGLGYPLQCSWPSRVAQMVKNPPAMDGDPSSIPGSGRSAGGGIGYPLQCSWPSFVAQLVKNMPAMQEPWVRSLGWEIPWRRERLPTPVFWPREFGQRVRHDWVTFTFNSYIYLPNLFSTTVYTFIKLTENRNLYQP